MLKSARWNCALCLEMAAFVPRSPFEVLHVSPDNGLYGQYFPLLQRIVHHIDFHHEADLAYCFVVLGASVSEMADLAAYALDTPPASDLVELLAD